ncbi:hypothetical protein CN918_26400 [Priestia megaterium]|nr:hypothetical protein CN918_26400 [Priestia megaterium]
MRKRDKQKQLILLALASLPIVSAGQLEFYFREYKQPNRRVSEVLNELQCEGLVEGKSREVGESKIWRLSKKGRQLMEVDRHPMMMTLQNVNHMLKIGDIFFTLEQSDNLQCFYPEPRLPFVNDKDVERTYCPDAFFVFDQQPYFLEVQLSPMAKAGWSYKWEVAEQYAQTDAIWTSPFSSWLTQSFPPILVLSSQKDTTIRQSNSLTLHVHERLEEMFPVIIEVSLQKQTETEFSKLNKTEVLDFLQSFSKDLEISKKSYKDMALGKRLDTIPLFSWDGVKKYEQKAKNLFK